MDGDGRSPTVMRGRLVDFSSAPDMGHDLYGRRHITPTQPDMTESMTMLECGKKLIMQMTETFQKGGKPTFVDALDAMTVIR